MQVTFLAVVPVVALLLMQLSSCEYFRAIRDLTVELPRLPEPWKQCLRPDAFRVSFLDSGGSVCTRTADGQQKFLEIETQKGFVIPVVAEPLVNGLRLPPSGGLYPIDSGSDGRPSSQVGKRIRVCDPAGVGQSRNRSRFHQYGEALRRDRSKIPGRSF